MTEEQSEVTIKRKGRGPGKKAALAMTSLRLPKYVLEYFNTYHAGNKQAKMREVLTNYVNQWNQPQGESHE